jgi:O-antigen/teichoic acid export membrane protein
VGQALHAGRGTRPNQGLRLLPKGDGLTERSEGRRGWTARSPIIGVAGRLGWGLGDQLLSSVTNFLLGLLVARAVTPSELGAFSIAFAVFTLSLGAVRALCGEPLVVRYSSVPSDHWRGGVKVAAGTAMTAGVVVGVGCVVAHVIVGGALGSVLLIVGLALPFLLLQDVWRFAFFAAGRGAGALLNDAVWATAMLSGIALLAVLRASSVISLTMVWAVAGCVAAAVGTWQLRIWPSRPSGAFGWLHQQRDLAPRFFAEFAISVGASNLTFFLIGALTGLATLGQVRAGQIALGPLNILFAAASLVTVPESVRLLKESPAQLVLGSRIISFGLAACALLWLGLVLLIPPDIGRIILGANWRNARAIIAPLSIGALGYGLSFGAAAGLRALAAAKRSLRARFVDALTALIFPLSGAVLNGATGAAWGYALAGLVKIPNAWWQFSRALREYESKVREDRTEVVRETPGAS